MINGFLPNDIPGITSGANNYYQEYTSALSKIGSGINGGIPFSTAIKGYASGVVGSAGMSIALGIKAFFDGTDTPLATFCDRLPQLVPWCFP